METKPVGRRTKPEPPVLTRRGHLTFEMPDAVVQKLLPAGFQINSPTTGPVKGSNLVIGFIDYLMVQDPDAKPLPPVPTVAMNVPSKKIASGESIGLIVGGFVAQTAAPGQREPETQRAPIASIFYLYNNEGCPTSIFYLLVDTRGSVDDLTCISSRMWCAILRFAVLKPSTNVAIAWRNRSGRSGGQGWQDPRIRTN
jgi:hypothetical protein